MSRQTQTDSLGLGLGLDMNANSVKVPRGSECDRNMSHNHQVQVQANELECLDTQIGGHSSRIEKYKKTKLGIYDLKNGLILKTLFPPPRGPRELKFYQNVFSSECNDSDLLELRQFIPKYHGTEENENMTMMKLTNLTAQFQKPCVMDLKMGRVTYDQEASAEKILYEEKKFPPLKKTGFQIVGMIIQNQTEKNIIDKHYTRSLDEKTLITDGLSGFFSILNTKMKRQVIQGIMSRLKKLEAWFLKQRRFSFTASSLLIIYEGMKGNSIGNESVCERTSASESSVSSKSNDNSSPSVGDNRKRSHDMTESGDDDYNFDSEHEFISSTKVRKRKEDDLGESNTVLEREDTREKKDGSTVSLMTESADDCFCADDTGEDIPQFSVHLIDFAHVFPTSNLDENFLFGLQNLISSLQMLTE